MVCRLASPCGRGLSGIVRYCCNWCIVDRWCRTSLPTNTLSYSSRDLLSIIIISRIRLISQQGSAQPTMLGLVVLMVHRIVAVWRHDLSNSWCIAAVRLLIAMQVKLALTLSLFLTLGCLWSWSYPFFKDKIWVFGLWLWVFINIVTSSFPAAAATILASLPPPLLLYEEIEFWPSVCLDRIEYRIQNMSGVAYQMRHIGRLNHILV